MALLFDEDYEILADNGLEYEEDEDKRFLIIKNYPLKFGLYEYDNKPLTNVDVLIIIPPSYNTIGNDMFWFYPHLTRVDKKTIPAACTSGKTDPRIYKGIVFCRWSRHFKVEDWKAKVDNIKKILDRIEWVLKNPDAKK